MRPVELAKPNVIEPKIIFASKPFSAFAIFPHPIAKTILQPVLLLSCAIVSG
jgi:hypothetical protein